MRILAAIAMLATVALSAQPYNLLLIISDDIGQDQSWLNNDPSATVAPQPRLESLASQGALLTGCRTMPVCSPSRMAIFTGRNQKRTGVYANTTNPMTAGEYTLSDELNSHGYATGLFGKWGLGTGDGNDTPRTWGGFDHYAGLINIAPSNYWNYTKIVNNVSVPVADKYLTTDTVDDAIAWIDAQSSPWAAVVCLNAAHAIGLTSNYSIPPAELVTSVPASASGVEAYRATIEAMDTEIGRLLDSVDTSNAIVIYVSDNGGENPQTPNVNGEKGSEYDDAHKVPLVIAGPGITAGFSSSYTCSLADLYPTVLKLVGNYATSSPNTIDGVDFSGLIAGDVLPKRHAFVAKNETGPFCATDGDFRLIDYQDATPDLFFDLRSDPHEESALTIGSLSGVAMNAYKNLRYALTTYTANDIEPEVSTNYAQPSAVTGGIRVVSGGTSVAVPTVGSATITCDEVAGATTYTLWKKAGDFAAWEDTGLTPSISGGVVTFTDPSPSGRPTYRITNDAPEP